MVGIVCDLDRHVVSDECLSSRPCERVQISIPTPGAPRKVIRTIRFMTTGSRPVAWVNHRPKITIVQHQPAGMTPQVNQLLHFRPSPNPAVRRGGGAMAAISRTCSNTPTYPPMSPATGQPISRCRGYRCCNMVHHRPRNVITSPELQVLAT